MKVKSTEFQQRVGYYLSLAEQGEVIEIIKNNNLEKVFKLQIAKSKTTQDNKITDKMKRARKLVTALPGFNAVKHQRNIRQ